ncbi:MAG: tyrosine-type recombinase/integrase [Pirellulales bacterium]
MRLAKYTLESFIAEVGVNPLPEVITVDTVRQWLAKEKWNEHTRFAHLGRLRSTFAHGIRHCGLTTNPAKEIAVVTPPPRAEVYTSEQLDHIFANIHDDLKQLCWFLNETGCRPGEAAKLEAHHFVAGAPNGEFTLGVREHKNGRKTRKERVIFLSAKATELTLALIKKYPTGKLFRTHRDKEWRDKHACEKFRHNARKLGIPDNLKLHSFRHTFATRHINNGVPIERVATWLGDTVQTVQRVYWHAIHRANRNLFKGLD